MCIKDIVVEGTVSQIFDRGPGSVFIQSRKKYAQKQIKSYPFFAIKQELRPKSEISDTVPSTRI